MKIRPFLTLSLVLAGCSGTVGDDVEGATNGTVDVSQAPLEAEQTATATTQSVTLSGLARRTKYFYQVTATSQGGATAVSAVFNFRTR